MKEREVWQLTIEALETFYDASSADPTTAPEDVTEEVLAQCLAASSTETAFVRESVLGVTHFEKLCDGALQGYCKYCKRNRGDRLSMYLMAYLTYFHFSDIGGETIRELFYRCTSTPRIAEFVEYLVDENAVRATALPIWRTTYDESFLDRTVFASIALIAEDARAQVVEWLRTKGTSGVTAACDASFSSHGSAAGPTSQRRSNAKRIASRAPALHTSKSRRLPPAEVREMAYTIPEPRPAAPKPARPRAPPATKPLTRPVGFHFHRAAGASGTATKEAVAPSPATVDPVTAPARGPRTDERRMRAILDKEVDTRMTQAAILREAHTYRKEEEAQERALADKEYNPHDTFSYESWRDEQREEEAHQRELLMLDHHLNALRSRERAAELREETQRRRQEEQRRMKQQQKKEKSRLAREKADELKKQRGFVTNLRREMDENRTAAQRSCASEKMRTADEVRAENDRLAQEAKEALEQERIEQAMVIEEIRRMRVRIREKQEALRAQRLEEQKTKPADSTPRLGVGASAEKGNLVTLSLCECRQELSRLRDEDARLEDEKRARIVEQREQAKHDRAQLEQDLKEERERRRRARESASEKRSADRQKVRDAQLKSENARMLELHDRLSQKREERQREWTRGRSEERQTRNELLLLSQDHTAVEQKRWLQQEHGATNRIAVEQQRRLAEKRKHG